jgi:hypothetical protein
MKSKTVFGICKLCGQQARLHESHILPAFVFRWLKSRSGKNGHIRRSDVPNQRVQDGLKEFWLCGACEALFSVDETAFAKEIFHPFAAGHVPMNYSEFMLRFCTSISWRVLTYAYGRNADARYTGDQKKLVEQAEKRWRDFLLRRAPHPGAFEQHAIGWGTISETTIPDLPKNINRFVTGPVTLDIVGSDSTLMTFAKLGPIMIFGHIQVRKRTWVGSKIAVKEGKFPSKKYILPPSLIGLLNEKAGFVEEAWEKLSPKQRKLIDDNIISKGESFFDSGQGKAIIADAEMFGIGAVLAKEN